MTAPIVGALLGLKTLRDTVRTCSPSSDAGHALTEALRVLSEALMQASIDVEWVPLHAKADEWGVPLDTAQKWAKRGLITAEKQGRNWYVQASATPPSLTRVSEAA
ncbi:hypothetical protein [Gemmatimonas sp.]|uniref:hypothetical protein n=1 Tax=Gemmatimonas sp. TaxID=1962908 RepID=UPI003DA2B006